MTTYLSSSYSHWCYCCGQQFFTSDFLEDYCKKSHLNRGPRWKSHMEQLTGQEWNPNRDAKLYPGGEIVNSDITAGVTDVNESNQEGGKN